MFTNCCSFPITLLFTWKRRSSAMQITAKQKEPEHAKELPPQQDKAEESCWSRMISGIVRPPRAKYNETMLGPKNLRLNETYYSRTNEIVLHNQKKIELTLYDPQYKNGWIILYLHGNSSSRLESTSIIKYLPFNFSLAAFDFMGCGKNYEEDLITLGFREAQQVETVVDFLKARQYKVILWGRSMGASTALRYGKAPIIVADSAFKSFYSLCKQIAKRGSPCWVPHCLVSCLFPCVFCKIKSDIEVRGNYDVEQLDIKESVTRISPQTTVIFLSGDKDVLIDKRNSEKLCAAFPGPHKHLQIFDGNHNSKRPEETIKKVMELIRKRVQILNKSINPGATNDKIELDLQI